MLIQKIRISFFDDSSATRSIQKIDTYVSDISCGLSRVIIKGREQKRCSSGGSNMYHTPHSQRKLPSFILGAFCLLGVSLANASTPREMDMRGRFISINKLIALNDPSKNQTDKICTSEITGVTNSSLIEEAFKKCTEQATHCLIEGEHDDGKSVNFPSSAEVEVVDAKEHLPGAQKGADPLNKIVVVAKDSRQILTIACSSSKTNEPMTLALAEKTLAGLIGLPEEREKDRPHSKEPPRDGSAIGYEH